jgi:hypothetical protein
MLDITIKTANNLQWTNPQIDFAIGISLCLDTFILRPESTAFRKKKSEYEIDCNNDIRDLPEFTTYLRKRFQIRDFGNSRDATSRLVSMFITACIPAALVLAITKRNNPSFKQFSNSIPVKQAFRGLSEYQQRYRIEYMRKPLGGVWIPEQLTIKEQFEALFRGLVNSGVLFDKRLEALLDYLRNITELCYNSGLPTWWAPMYLVTRDIVHWVGPVPTQELGIPTLDGMLGIVFPRQIAVPHIELPSKELIGNDVHYEWLLISMSEAQAKEYLGINTQKRCHQLLKKWGYVPAHKWHKMDFDMFFDRALARNSVEIIAERYDRDRSLSRIIHLPLPVAPYKKHIKN